MSLTYIHEYMFYNKITLCYISKTIIVKIKHYITITIIISLTYIHDE